MQHQVSESPSHDSLPENVGKIGPIRPPYPPVNAESLATTVSTSVNTNVVIAK